MVTFNIRFQIGRVFTLTTIVLSLAKFLDKQQAAEIRITAWQDDLINNNITKEQILEATTVFDRTFVFEEYSLTLEEKERQHKMHTSVMTPEEIVNINQLFNHGGYLDEL